ncbi:MAG: hypothetical protein KIT22_06405 [Verrucomicrobiae bacterium]|nr:hypothetical protein [Verrucomicrobiae bacterium]
MLLEIPAFHVSTNNLAASADLQEPAHLGIPAARSLWARWRPGIPGQANLTLQTDGSSRVRLAVYIGNDFTQLSLVTGITNISTNSVWFLVDPEATYQVVVDSAPGSGAAFQLDGSVARLVLEEPSPGVRLRAPTNVTLRVRAGDNDPLIATEFLADGQSLGVITAPPFAQGLSLAQPGTVRVEAVATNSAGERLTSHSLDLVARPFNDDVADADLLSPTATDGLLSGDSQWASAEASDRTENPPRRSLWWRWSPRYGGRARFWLPGVEPPQSVNLRQGPTATNLGPSSVLLNTPVALERFLEVSPNPEETVWLDVAGRTRSGPSPVEVRFELKTLTFDPPPVLEARLGDPVIVQWRAFDPNLKLQDVALMNGDTILATGDPLAGELTWNADRGGILQVHLLGVGVEGLRHESFPERIVIPPANDGFAGAEVLPGELTTLTFTNRSALLSAEPDEPAHAGVVAAASLWWSWTPDSSGVAELRVAAPDFFLLQLAAYTGDALTQLTPVASNANPRGPLRDRLIFPVEGGRTYRLVVDGGTTEYERVFTATLTRHEVGLRWPLLGGDLSLGATNLLTLFSTTPEFVPTGAQFFLDGQLIGEAGGPLPELPWLGIGLGPHELIAVATNVLGESRQTPIYPVVVAPFNDLLVNAVDLPSEGAWPYSGDHGQSSWENGETDGGVADAGSVWLKWRPPSTRGYLFHLTGGPSTQVGIHQQDAAGNLWLTDRIGAGLPEHPIYLTPENTVYFQIHGPWTEGVPAPFTIELLLPPVNDDLANAILLTGSHLAFTGTNSGATLENEEPLSGLKGTLWWTWVAPASGDLTLTAAESDCSVGVALYRGADPASLQQVGSTSTLVSFTDSGVKITNPAAYRVAAGQTYYLALGASWSGGPETGLIQAILDLQPIAGLPPNDDPDQPTVLTGDAVTLDGSNRNATAEDGVMGGLLRHTVWYEWTAPLTGSVKLSVTSTNFQPLLYIGRNRFPSFQNINYDITGFSEPIYADIVAGETYILLLGGVEFDGGEGDFSIRLEASPLPPIPDNDRIADRIRITGETFSAQVSLQSATLEPGEPERVAQGASSYLRGSLWWEYTAPRAGFLIGSVAWPAELTFFRFGDGNSLIPVEVVPGERPVVVPIAAGDALVFAVHGARLHPDNYALDLILYPQRPANDGFADSIRLEGDRVTLRGFLRGATREAGEPNHALSPGSDPLTGESCWWSWAAPFTGRVVLEQTHSDLHRLGVYQGPAVNRLTRVSSSRSFSSDTFTAEAGQVYHFGVEGLQGASGFAEATLVLEPFGPTLNDHFAEAIRVTPAAWESRQTITTATREPGEPQHHAGIASGAGSKSLWWRFTMPHHAELEVRNDGGTVRNAAVAVYTGSRVEALTRKASGLDYVRFPAEGGVDYAIAIEAAADALGDVQLVVNPLWATGRRVAVAGNLVRNPSFEELQDGSPGKDWTIEPGYAGTVGAPPPGAADGANYIDINSETSVRQEVPTVSGRRYRVRYATRGTGGTNTAHLRVLLDQVAAGDDTYSPGWPDTYWHWFEHEVVAPSDNSTLTVESLGESVSLDDISLVWLNEPPALVTTPQGAFAYVGGSASFVAGATGSDPLTYQWFHNDEIIPGAGGHVLVVEPVTAADAGAYRVEISNPFGSTNSPAVNLEVQTASSPQIVVQPQGDAVVPGQYYALSVTAVGPDPLTYQWFHDGALLPGATARVLEFTNILLADLGEYTVVVGSYTETSTSLPAVLSRAPESPGPGIPFQFASLVPVGEVTVDARVFDVDGITPLHGPRFAAQLYAGATVDRLRPVGSPQPFLDGFNEGRWAYATVLLPNIPAGEPFVTQVRAWDQTRAASYEEARALGFRFGRSRLLNLSLSDPPLSSEFVLAGLDSFALQLGLPDFTVGHITASLSSAGDQLDFHLTVTGAAGFRYLLEQRMDGAHWKPVQVFEEFSGEATFSIPVSEGNAVLYRARILD